MQSAKVNKIFDYLSELFPEPKCELNYSSGLELLIAIILSAQCTDVMVNKVTTELFRKYKNLSDYANADFDVLSQEIKSTGFYQNKARNVMNMARIVRDEYGGVIPAEMEKLVLLPGVGRKTASVFLAEYHGIPAIAVDTHVGRVSYRLGMTEHRDPEKIERDLSEIWARENWAKYHILMVLFGRYHCKAQNPNCANCKLKSDCRSKKQGGKNVFR